MENRRCRRIAGDLPQPLILLYLLLYLLKNNPVNPVNPVKTPFRHIQTGRGSRAEEEREGTYGFVGQRADERNGDGALLALGGKIGDI